MAVNTNLESNRLRIPPGQNAVPRGMKQSSEQGRVGVVLVPFWSHFGVDLGSFWCHFRPLGVPGVASGSSRRPGVSLGVPGASADALWGVQGAPLERPGASLGAPWGTRERPQSALGSTRAPPWGPQRRKSEFHQGLVAKTGVFIFPSWGALGRPWGALGRSWGAPGVAGSASGSSPGAPGAPLGAPRVVPGRDDGQTAANGKSTSSRPEGTGRGRGGVLFLQETL